MPIWYGGDYNPEQWPEEVWAEDVTLMQRAGVTLATVGVFSWAKLEPRDGEFDFGWLDRVIDGLHAGGVRVDLATATASPPAWLTKKHPEILPVTADGVTLYPGSRQQYSPSSPVYRRYAVRLVRALAERYGAHPAVEMWHINNEYGCHVSHDYSEAATEAFRGWLEAKYGTVERLNEAWGTAFWSQGYGAFDEVFPPRAMPTFKNPGHQLDFDRFSARQLLECYLAEKAVLTELSPGKPITTNFMGFFPNADYWEWAPHVDFVSDDLYPDPADPDAPVLGAMTRDLMRSLKKDTPWLLMEQATSAVNWRTRNAPKKPGMMRAWSHQVFGRGADGIMFFQWRQSVAGAEKFHSGMVPHAGTDTRVFHEVEQLGAELATLERIIGTGVEARVGIVFDWDSWRSFGQDALPTEVPYVAHVLAWYRELLRRHVAVDFVQASEDLSSYDVVIAPALFVASPADLAALGAFAEAGGQLVVTFQTGIVDRDSHITAGGYLGSLQDVLGVRIEEFAPLAGVEADPTVPVPTTTLAGVAGGFGGGATVWREYLQVAEGTEVVATFGDDDLAGWPAITRRATAATSNARGGSTAGAAWYVATWPDDAVVGELLGRVLGDAGVSGVVAEPIADVELVRRGELVFAINHGSVEVTVPVGGVDLLAPGTGPVASVTLAPQGVAILAPEA